LKQNPPIRYREGERFTTRIPLLHSRWLPFLLLLLAVLLPFGVSLGNLPIGDDVPLLHSRLDPDRILDLSQLWTENYWGHLDDSGLYRPLSLSLLYAERLAFGLNNVPYRAVSLALYFLCGVFCYLFLARILPPRAALAAALLFLLHPAHVEVVITAYGQVEILAALFSFATLYAYARGASPLLTAPLFLAAMLSKEVAVPLPILAALTRGFWLAPTESGRRRWLDAHQIGFAAALALYAAAKLLALGTVAVPAVASAMAGRSLVQRLFQIFSHGLGNYLRLSIFPLSQSTIYDYFPSVAASLVWVLAGVVVLALAYRSLGPRPALFATAWFAATWFVFSNLVIPTGVFVAERCLFLPIVSICLLFGLAAEKLRTAAAVVLLLAAAQSASTAWQWRTEESSLRASLVQHPASPTTRSLLALALIEGPSSQHPEAESLLRQVLAQHPELPEVHRGLGLLAKARGDYNQAIGHLRRGLQFRPRDVFLQDELALCERLALSPR
jgi:tetratricopeptide (TPR) repeat protein